MSLFGVAGYMGSVGKNRPAIKVDSYELLYREKMEMADKVNVLNDALQNYKTMSSQEWDAYAYDKAIEYSERKDNIYWFVECRRNGRTISES